MKRLFVYILLFIGALFVYSYALAETYPQLDISGFKKYEYKNLVINEPKNYFLALTELGDTFGYTGGPWQERLKLEIMGRLSDKLSVSYSLEQQPEFPDKYDVKVRYDKTELTFGDFYANFTGNEYASTTKFLNGVMLTSMDGWYNLLLVPSAKIKSYTQSLTSQTGNNTRGPYSLGRGSIVEDSEYVEINGRKARKDTDYTIDYFEGKITFTSILTPSDEFKYTFEYTNIIDLFFPTLSKRNFFGFRGDLKIDPTSFGKEELKPEPVIEDGVGVFPTAILDAALTLEAGLSEKKEEEGLGIYRLKNYPIVKFSEKINYKGSVLKKDIDYSIDYDKGRIKLTTPTIPSFEEQLNISYQYLKVSEQVEIIKGNGSRGPYNFSKKTIVVGSERIVIDEIPYVRDLDYTIDYKEGKITFGFKIGPTQNIMVRYKYVYTALPPAPPPPKYAQTITIGSSYLRESAQKSEGELTSTISETISNTTTYKTQHIIDKNNNLYLAHFPVISTEEVTLKLNGVELVYGTDYVFPTVEADKITKNAIVYPADARIGFRYSSDSAGILYLTDKLDLSDGLATGTIKLLFTPLAADEITAIYSYKKNIFGTYSGQGTGSPGPYYVENFRNIVPGTEIIRRWIQGSSDVDILTRNSSIDVYDGDYSINYSGKPSIIFNLPLETNENYSTTFYYVPPNAPEGSDINRDIFAFDGSYKYGDLFKVEGQVARSSADQVYITAPGSFEGSGDGSKTYILNSPEDIIEDSEQVYINNVLINKDQDYFINYSKPGAITLYYITPGTADAIAVYYNYQSTSGIVGEVVPKSGTAYSFGASGKVFDAINVSGNMKEIEYSFTPMGGTSMPLGSKQKNFSARTKPMGPMDFTAAYDYRESNDPLRGYEEIAKKENLYSNKYDSTISTAFKVFDLAGMDLSYRKYETLDEEAPGLSSTEAQRHKEDNLLETYSGSLALKEMVFGSFKLRNRNNFKYTETQTETKDRDDPAVIPTTTRTKYFQTINDVDFTERVKYGVDLQLSEPQTIGPSLEAGVTTEVETNHTYSRDITNNLNVDLTFAPIHRLTTSVTVMNHLLTVLEGSDVPAETNNQTFRVNFYPWSNLSTTFDKNRQETQKVTFSGNNPLSERTSFNTLYTPLSNLSLSSYASWDRSVQENGDENNGDSNTISVNYTPYSLSNFKLSTTLKKYNRFSKTTYGSENRTDTLGDDCSITYIPIAPVSINSMLSYENYFNILGTSLSDTINLGGTVGIAYSMTKDLNLSANYDHKSTFNKRTRDEAPKDTVDAKISYGVFNWGTLTYDFSHERNKGEIQGGVYAELDLAKIRHGLSIDFNIPQDNLILRSIVLRAAWKQLEYLNYKNEDTNFIAQLWTFEGTLNF